MLRAPASRPYPDSSEPLKPPSPSRRTALVRAVVLARAVLGRAVLGRAVLGRAVLGRAVLARAVLARAVKSRSRRTWQPRPGPTGSTAGTARAVAPPKAGTRQVARSAKCSSAANGSAEPILPRTGSSLAPGVVAVVPSRPSLDL